MPQPDKPGIPWNEIRDRRIAGETSRQIAKDYDITRQAIEKREKKEGWFLSPATKGYLATARQPAFNQDKGTPERKALILEGLSKGLTYSLAADEAGIAESTLRNWRQEDPDFAQACRSALAQHAKHHTTALYEAAERGDVNAAKWMLERHPSTRGEYQPAQQSGGGPQIQVILNIPKPEPINVIEAEAVVVTEALEG